jgi:sugar phosphate isomerase/epimerase
VRLACQEHILPGEDILEKWEFAAQAGLDGIELRGTDDWNGRLDSLRAARKQGAVFSSVCLISDRFIGAFDAGRREAVEHMKHLLTGIAELGGTGAVTPAAFGLASKRLPPSRYPAPKKRTAACCSTRWKNWVSTPKTKAPSCSSNRSTATKITC